MNARPVSQELWKSGLLKATAKGAPAEGQTLDLWDQSPTLYNCASLNKFSLANRCVDSDVNLHWFTLANRCVDFDVIS